MDHGFQMLFSKQVHLGAGWSKVEIKAEWVGEGWSGSGWQMKGIPKVLKEIGI